jgi:uncharacterized protein (DUF58 family)
MRTFSGDSSGNRSSSDGEYAGLRPYRRGDSIRSIHWQQSARHERLIVRERAASQQSICVVCLDVRSSSYPSPALFETAVSLLAGAMNACERADVMLVAWIGESRFECYDERHRRHLLDRLARIEPNPHATLAVPTGFRRAALITPPLAWRAMPGGAFVHWWLDLPPAGMGPK